MMLKRFEPRWIADHIDIMGISIDSASPSTNLRIGRATRSGEVMDVDLIRQRIAEVRSIDQGTLVKVNTVVSIMNQAEDLSKTIRLIAPDSGRSFRCFQFMARMQPSMVGSSLSS
jgi:hypothetical protein